jgi:anaerobic ribonucleoside-triphosphate reductase activating protein
LKKCNHCTCICFLGGDNDHTYLADLIDKIKAKHNIKIAVYSGLSTLDNALLQRVDYYKVGPFIKEKGPLNNKNTNQRFYKISDGKLMDITYKFQKERV